MGIVTEQERRERIEELRKRYERLRATSEWHKRESARVIALLDRVLARLPAAR